MREFNKSTFMENGYKIQPKSENIPKLSAA